MPKHNNPNSIHAQRLKRIRPFVDFDYDLRKPLTKYQKRKIKIYYDEIRALTARPYQVYRPRRKDRLAKAQRFAQHEKRLSGLKVAFIPTDGVNKVRVRFDSRGEITVKSRHVKTRVINLSVDELIRDPVAHVKTVLAGRKENSFTVLCGRYEIPVGLNKATAPEYVANLTAKYADENTNNYFGNWLHAMAAYTFTGQKTFGEYLAKKQASKRKLQRQRRNAVRKQAR